MMRGFQSSAARLANQRASRPEAGGAALASAQAPLVGNRASLLRQIRINGTIMLLCAAFAQGFIDASFENIMMVLLILSVSLIAGAYCLREVMFTDWLVSTLQVMATAGTLLAFPLLFVTLEWHPAVFNLEAPLPTFGYSALTVLSIIVAHILYRRLPFFGEFRRNFVERWLVRWNIFHPPSSPQLWIIGGVGWFALFYIYLFLPDRGTFSVGALDKFIQAFVPFVYAPLIIPFKKLYGAKSKTVSPVDWVLLFGYMLSILLLALGRNSRTVFSAPILLILLGVTIGGLLGHYKIKLFSAKMLGGAVLLGLAGIVLANLALAMQITRAARGSVNSRELMMMSIAAMTDRQQLQEYRHELYSVVGGNLDEYYVANPFFARFANPKFTDNIFGLTAHMGDADRKDLLDVSLKRMMATFPAPLLYLLRVDVDKIYVTGFSSGDYIYYMASGQQVVLGRMRGGSFIGSGVFMFHWWGYSLVMLIAALVIFTVSDMLTRRVSQLGPITARLGGRAGLIVSPFVLMWGYDLVFIFNTEAVTDYPGILLRGVIQPLFFYALMVKASSFVVPME